MGANVYVVGPNQPTVAVQLADTTGPVRSALQAAFVAVPIPPDAQPGSDSDAELTVWQSSTDKPWEFFHMQLLSDGWHATWGGAMDHVAKARGISTRARGRALQPAESDREQPAPGRRRDHGGRCPAGSDRSCARGQPALSLPDDLFLAGTAHRRAGTASNCIPEGAHLRLDPTLNIPALHLPKFVQMMAEAAQTYGIIVRDQTKWAIGFWIRPRRWRAPAIRSTTAPASRRERAVPGYAAQSAHELLPLGLFAGAPDDRPGRVARALPRAVLRALPERPPGAPYRAAYRSALPRALPERPTARPTGAPIARPTGAPYRSGRLAELAW